MLGVYCCPDCSGTEIVWDRRLSQAVCAMDNTPVSEFKLHNNI